MLFQELEDTYREELRNNAVKFIFVCHSLGGLIVKQALVGSASHGRAPSSIKRSTFGLAFFGTPHGGSEAATRYSGFAAMFRKLIGESNIKNHVLESLADNSNFIRNLTYRFRQQEYDYQYATFYETKSTSVSSSYSFPRLGNLIVSIISAGMGLPRGMEKRRLVDEDHLRMCKPPSRRSNHYLRIKKALQILVAEALGYPDEFEYMRAIRTLRPNFRPQQNYDSDEENEVDYESDSSGSHNALLQDNHIQKSLANTDKVVAVLVGAAALLTAGAVYISHKEKQAGRSDYQTATRQGHENSARRRLKRCEEPPTRDHHSSRKVAFPQDPFPLAPHPYMSTRGGFPAGIYYVPMPHYTAPPLYERRRSDTRQSYRREG